MTPLFYKAPRYVFRKYNILSILKEKSDIRTFLDVGCGAGELACTLAENGMRGVAVDFSENAINVASTMKTSRNIKKSDLTFHLGGLENVLNKKFDLVSCFEVLEHVENDQELLRQITAHSKKYVLISVPAKQKLYDASDKAVGHFRRYEKRDLLNIINESDLTVVRFINYGFPFTNIVRVIRRVFFIVKLRRDKNKTMKNRSKGSGTNPIKLPKFITMIDFEKAIMPLYQISRVFNNYDFSEGYLVLCSKKE
jgi:SAM-dependent methyltransferase